MIGKAVRDLQEFNNTNRTPSDCLHSLSQPLTALHCALELSLLRDRTLEEFRHSVEAALENVSRLRTTILMIRELQEADDPGDVSQPVRADRLIRQVWENLLPIAKSAGVRIELLCDPVTIRGNQEKLEQAFFCLMEPLVSSCAPGDVIDVSALVDRPWLQVYVMPHHAAERPIVPPSVGLAGGGQWEIAGRMFQAAEGKLFVPSEACGLIRYSVKLRFWQDPSVVGMKSRQRTPKTLDS